MESVITIVVVTCLFVVQSVHGAAIPEHLRQEGHAIRKRFAEKDHEFHGHDIAFVLHEKQPNSFHRIAKRDLTSVTNDNSASRIRLDLSSGHQLHLNLRKRSVVSEDTEFFYHTENGMVKREAPDTDCYATGHEEGDGGGIASVSTCNGLHGTVASGGVDYYIHPVETDGGEHQVHVLWRPSTENENGESVPEDDLMGKVRRGIDATFDAWKTEDSIVIEMAVFTDARYWNRLQELVPGREDEYLLVAMAATAVLFGDPAKVGYDFNIKVKLLIHWQVDPEGYVFAQDLETNLNQFCKLTQDQYKYDMHFLHTYVTEQNGPAAGIAYMAGVCRNTRCVNIRTSSPGRQSLMAHEIGHNLGFNHHDVAKCPDDVKALAGSFMGGGNPLNFSPCNKIELQTLFESGKGECLFTETAKRKVSKSYMNSPRVFPGQSRSPDELCKLFAGKGYKYFRPFQLLGKGECALFLCINMDKKSPGFKQIRKVQTPKGFPCGNEMFCRQSDACVTWDEGDIGWDVDHLRSIRQSAPLWTSWPKRWDKCSRQCGTGVQFKERQCKYKKGVSLSPYCQGEQFQARLCNKKPCSDESATLEEIRQQRGDDVCTEFYNAGVILSGKEGMNYYPKATTFAIWTSDQKYFATKSCILSCKRETESHGNIDSIYPDGTPCLESYRSAYNLERFNIEMRCAKGLCMEFSNCPDNKPKDACGICGGDPARCKTKTVVEDTQEGNRITLAEIPVGSTGIDVHLVKKGGRLELWNEDDQPLIAKDGQYPKGKYLDEKMVDYAGTKWSFDSSRFLRAEGPTEVWLTVKILRESSPIGLVEISYLLPNVD